MANNADQRKVVKGHGVNGKQHEAESSKYLKT